jgi:hypothetical protein
MTTNEVCWNPRKVAAGEGREPGKKYTTYVTGKEG